MSTWPAISTIIGAVVVVAGVFVAYFRQVIKISERVSCLESDNKVFWQVISPHLAQLIHQSSAPRRDELVERLTTGQELDRSELEELLVLLRAIVMDPAKAPEKQLAAALLAARTEQQITRLRTRSCDMRQKGWSHR
jgi:hypothetical protein